MELPPFEDETPPGDKKILRPFDDPHFAAYSPKVVESAWCRVPPRPALSRLRSPGAHG